MTTRRKKSPVLLADYVERFLASRDVSLAYVNQLRARLKKFSVWFLEKSGRELTVSDIDCDLVNEWLLSVKKTGVTAKKTGFTAQTIDGYRRNILVVWNDLLTAGLTEKLPTRLLRMRKPHIVIEAYTHDEIRKLLNATRRMRGTYPQKISCEHFWRAAVHSGYSTGLRRGDLLAVKRTQIAADGAAIVVQRKTGYPVRVRFSRPALAAIEKLRNIDGRALPWPMTANWFCQEFLKLRRLAGITRGTFKWLRRSASSYAEQTQCGRGSQLLGHRDPKVFRNHYEDWAISVQTPIGPPAIKE